MAFPNPAAACSSAAYEPYLRLNTFPPAQAYCSSLFSERPVQLADPNCRGESDLCTLLSYLQAADLDFAQTVCCCIGNCYTSKTTLVSIVTSPESHTSPASSEIGSTGLVSSILSEPSGLTTSTQTILDIPTSSNPSNNYLSNSSLGHLLSTSSISTKPPISSNLSRARTTSLSYASSTTLTSRKQSTTNLNTAILTSAPSPSAPKTSPASSNPPISTHSSTSSTRTNSESSSRISSPTSSTTSSNPASIAPSTTVLSTCAKCSYPTPTAACTSLNGYEQYHSGECHTENTNNPGNIDPLYPPIYSTYPGTYNACDAATMCALQSEGIDVDVYTSFDLHYLCSNASWVCVQYYGATFRSSYFDVQDFDAVAAYGYYSATLNHKEKELSLVL